MHLVPFEPTEAMWGGLARDVIQWMRAYDRQTGESLLKHLHMSGEVAPQWLIDECGSDGGGSLPKGTIASIIYKAMVMDSIQK